MTGHDLRDFLTSRRAALTPEEVGLPFSADSRRMAGLRREEVAILAGVSVDYYIKFEQGRAQNVSEQVLQSIERVLRLDPVERLHLRSLLRPSTSPAAELADMPVKVRPSAWAILHSISLPALLFSAHLDVLGVNAAGKVLVDDFDAMPEGEHNFVRWMYLNPRARVVYREWAEVAALLVAILRCSSIGTARNESLERLIGGLSVASPEFARSWSEYRVKESGAGKMVLFNEVVGEMHLNFETVHLAADPGQFLMVTSADAGSADEEKLQLLASWGVSSGELL